MAVSIEVTAVVVVEVLVDVKHIVLEIDPDDSLNISVFKALECTQVTPHSVWLKDVALWNMQLMSPTHDTSHLDKSNSWLKDFASENIHPICFTLDMSHLDKSWLKDTDYSNIKLMSTTRDTSQLDRS